MYYYQPKFQNESEITYDPNSVTRALDDRSRHNKDVNMCVNWELRRQYGLKAYSEVEYCITNRDKIEIDSLDWWTAAVWFVLIKVIISSTLYDFYLKRNDVNGCNHQHYKLPLDGKCKMLLFSSFILLFFTFSFRPYIIFYSFPKNPTLPPTLLHHQQPSKCTKAYECLLQLLPNPCLLSSLYGHKIIKLLLL